MVDIELWWREDVLGLSSPEDLLLNSTVEAAALWGIGSSLKWWERGSWLVLGRAKSSVVAEKLLVEPPELVGKKKDVSTFSLDFLR